MGDLYEPLSKLPKNIRQIGDRDDTVRLYIEDYVSTYLKRLFPSGGQDLRAGLLLGTERTENGVPFIFVNGGCDGRGRKSRVYGSGLEKSLSEYGGVVSKADGAGVVSLRSARMHVKPAELLETAWPVFQ